MRRLALSAAIALAALAAVATAADGAVTIGPNPLPNRTVVIGKGNAKIFMTAGIPGVTTTSPTDGVIVRWRARRGNGPGGLPADKITLRILQPTGALNQFKAVGTSEAHDVPDGDPSDPLDVYEFPTRLPIAAGETIGLGTTTGDFPAATTLGSSFLVRLKALKDGEAATFEAGGLSDRYVLINADVEPDCDQDGFGDETQDSSIPQSLACGFIGPLVPPAAPPNTGITKAPKKKATTHGHRATVRFKFTSDDPAATFECSLDKGKYRHCISPQLYLVKASLKSTKHTFRVRATDAAGNVDPTPATATFRLKRASSPA